jgi:cell division protein FtsB
MRLLLLSLILVLALLQGRLWLSDDGMREVRRLNYEVTARSDENRKLAARNVALEAEVLNLKQELAAAEERARADLGMIAEGETFYQIAPYQSSRVDAP